MISPKGDQEVVWFSWKRQLYMCSMLCYCIGISSLLVRWIYSGLSLAGGVNRRMNTPNFRENFDYDQPQPIPNFPCLVFTSHFTLTFSSPKLSPSTDKSLRWRESRYVFSHPSSISIGLVHSQGKDLILLNSIKINRLFLKLSANLHSFLFRCFIIGSSSCFAHITS